MNYHVYWSVADTPSEQIRPGHVILLAGIAVLGLTFFFTRRNAKISAANRKLIKWSGSIFGVFLLGLYLVVQFSSLGVHEDPFKMLNDRHLVSTVEGKIENFKIDYVQTRDGLRTTESFSVDSVEFAYDDYAMSAFNSFTKTHQNGGILESGDQVRITYLTGSKRMLKIEIAN